jgi:hypothetical protein
MAEHCKKIVLTVKQKLKLGKKLENPVSVIELVKDCGLRIE